MGDCCSTEAPPERRPLVGQLPRKHNAQTVRNSSVQELKSTYSPQETKREISNDLPTQQAITEPETEKKNFDNQSGHDMQKIAEQERVKQQKEVEKAEQERIQREEAERIVKEKEQLIAARINKKIQAELIKLGSEVKHLAHTAKEVPREKLSFSQKKNLKRQGKDRECLEKVNIPNNEIPLFSFLALHRPKGKLLPVVGRMIITPNYVSFTTGGEIPEGEEDEMNELKKMAKGGKLSKKTDVGKRIIIPFWEIEKLEKVRGKLTASKRVIVIRTSAGGKFKFTMAQYCKIAYVALNYLRLYPVLYVHVQELTEEERQRIDEMNQNLARIVTEIKAMDGGDLVIPNIKELEDCITLIEGLVEDTNNLRSKVHEQSLILDRVTSNLQYVTQNLEHISRLVRSIDSKAATMYEMLQRKKEKEHIKKVEREIGHAIGQEMIIPSIIIFKMGLGIGPRSDLHQCYLYMVEDFFAIVYRTAEVEDFHPKSRFYHEKRFVLVKDYHFEYSEISSICLTVIPQMISIQCRRKNKPIRLFSGFVQHIVNELALRNRVGTFPVFCQPGAKKFQYRDVEIKKVPIPDPGRSALLPPEVIVNPYIPPPAGPDLSPEEVKRDIAKHVQEQGIDHIQEMVTILTQDQELLKKELTRQLGQLDSITERTDSNINTLHEQSFRVSNV